MSNAICEKTNNDQLRAIIEASGLTQTEALAIFNRDLGPAAYSRDSWMAFLANPESRRYRKLKDTLLAHAQAVLPRKVE